MTFILSVLEILQKHKNRKKIRGPSSPVCPVCRTLLLPHAHFLPSLTCSARLVPTRDCIPKLTFLTRKRCFPLEFRWFREGNTSRRSEDGGREVVVIIPSGATAQVPSCMALEWLCRLQLQFLSSLFASKATSFASDLGCKSCPSVLVPECISPWI